VVERCELGRGREELLSAERCAFASG
jgi:hypothetical protein